MGLINWMKSIMKKNNNPYPKTVEEVLDDSIKYRPATEEAILNFKKSKPWRGTKRERQKKIRILLRELAGAYDIYTPQIVFVHVNAGSFYFPRANLIVLEQETDGRYSVVTLLHEFGHALGKNEVETCRWSINLFRKFFPKSYGRLVPKGHLLYRPESEK